MTEEVENIKQRYEKRKKQKVKTNFYYSYFCKAERELKYLEILKNKFNNFGNIKIMEIGAGQEITSCFFIEQVFRYRIYVLMN